MFTGIVNVRPETKDRYEPPVDLKKLPFDPTGEPDLSQ